MITTAVFAAALTVGAPVGDVRLHGPVGDRMDAMIRRHVTQTDPCYLAHPFHSRTERIYFHSEFWGKYMHAAPWFWRYTGSPELKANIERYLESQGMQDRLAAQILDSLSEASANQKSVEQILDEETERLCAEDSDLKYLVQEYHDGLLLFEECNREVWEPASKDTTAIERYFKKNKKQYAWDKPHFRGMVYYCQQASDVKAVKKLLKKVDEKQWTATTRDRFNKDSVTVRMEYRMFTQGDNPNVDVLAFKAKDAEMKPVSGFPYAAVVGKVLKKGPEQWSDVGNQVVTDYQHMREDEFVQSLRQRYPVEIDKEALKTVNNH